MTGVQTCALPIDELTLVFKDVMSMGDDSSPAERIAVALVRAQELGLELPPTIANFSSCQMRLQNTIGDMNKSLLTTRANLKNIMEQHSYSQIHKQVDPVAKLLDDSKNMNAELKKANAQQILMSRGVINEDEFRQKLRDKTKRDELRDANGYNRTVINDLIKEDAKRINDYISGKLKAPAKYDSEDSDKYFPALMEVMDREKDKKQAQFYAKLKNSALQMFVAEQESRLGSEELYGKPESFEDFVERIKSVNKHLKDYKLYQEPSETEKRLNEFYKAQDDEKTTPEQLKQLEDAVWESYIAEKGDTTEAKEAKKNYINELKDKFCPKKRKDLEIDKALKWYRETGLDLIHCSHVP